MKKTQQLIATATLLCSLFGIVSCSNAPDTTASPIAANAKTETVTLALTGLQCVVGCPPKVQAALASINGVYTVSATKTSATVLLDRNQVSNAQLIKAVQSAGKGFSATVAN